MEPGANVMSRYTFADLLTSAGDPRTSRLSAINVASLLGIRQEVFATIAGVHRNTLHTHPEPPRLQAALHDIMRALSAAIRVQPDVERALFLYTRDGTISEEEGRRQHAVSLTVCGADRGGAVENMNTVQNISASRSARGLSAAEISPRKGRST